MSNITNLKSYLPTFIVNYREISEALDSQDPEFQIINNEVERIKNNQFILTSDEVGIARFEKMLKIIPNKDDNLESRISRVFTRWNDSIPYTYRRLIEMLINLCGENNYIVVPPLDNYQLDITVYLPLSGQVDELELLISYMIPENLIVNSLNLLPFNANGSIYTGSTNIELKTFTITSELTRDVMSQGNFYNASTMTKILEYTIN